MRVPAFNPTVTLVASALWTAVVWGSRISIAEGELTTTEWFRIAGSLVFVAVLLLVASRVRQQTAVGTTGLLALSAYAVWMIAVWVPSVLSVFAGGYPTGFVVVHTILALVSLASAVLVGNIARGLDLVSPGPRPATPPQTEPTDTRSSTRTVS